MGRGRRLSIPDGNDQSQAIFGISGHFRWNGKSEVPQVRQTVKSELFLPDVVMRKSLFNMKWT
jgi:hypothetical protein